MNIYYLRTYFSLSEFHQNEEEEEGRRRRREKKRRIFEGRRRLRIKINSTKYTLRLI